jgi:hypothetical protein
MSAVQKALKLMFAIVTLRQKKSWQCLSLNEPQSVVNLEPTIKNLKRAKEKKNKNVSCKKMLL